MRVALALPALLLTAAAPPKFDPDTLAWWSTVPETRRTAPRFALTPEQEATVLAAWKAKKG